ncbi:hypothetical protein [Photobacterium toruni]|uniref:hypothetical protein n=1 Tax=Photobacterium toruni TaxID=1935446 RepID=UPI002110A23C|nr:hypothetical protein [Photobacterium toruni]
MKKLLDQVSKEETRALEFFLTKGKKRILANREFCTLSMSSFVDYYIQTHDGKLVNALVKFTLSANCSSSNTLLSLQGFQVFADDAFDSFFEDNDALILRTFHAELKEHYAEQEIAAAGL